VAGTAGWSKKPAVARVYEMQPQEKKDQAAFYGWRWHAASRLSDKGERQIRLQRGDQRGNCAYALQAESGTRNTGVSEKGNIRRGRRDGAIEGRRRNNSV